MRFLREKILFQSIYLYNNSNNGKRVSQDLFHSFISIHIQFAPFITLSHRFFGMSHNQQNAFFIDFAVMV